MNRTSDKSPSGKWKQVRFDVEHAFPAPGNNIPPKRCIPVSGIICIDAFHSTTQSSYDLLVSALPLHGSAILPSCWGASAIPNCLCSFDGGSLAELGFHGYFMDTFRVTPFAKKVNQNITQVVSPSNRGSSVNISNIAEELSAKGICYKQKKNPESSAVSFEFLEWTENQLQLQSANGDYALFIGKVEKGVQTSFWGAPIITSGGKVESIVVHQRNVDDETVAIVGMQIASFANKYPTVLAPLSSI